MIPSLVLDCTLGLLHDFNLRRTECSQVAFMTEICSPGESSFLIIFPEGRLVSAVANLSAVSFPENPE